MSEHEEDLRPANMLGCEISPRRCADSTIPMRTWRFCHALTPAR